jgi:hypothetical protein
MLLLDVVGNRWNDCFRHCFILYQQWFIEDDAIGEYTGATDKYGIKRMGGIAGGSTGSNTIMENCINNGNVFSYLGCRVGGFSGHNEGMIKKCTNMGAILADNQVVGTTITEPVGLVDITNLLNLLKIVQEKVT